MKSAVVRFTGFWKGGEKNKGTFLMTAATAIGGMLFSRHLSQEVSFLQETENISAAHKIWAASFMIGFIKAIFILTRSSSNNRLVESSTHSFKNFSRLSIFCATF